MARGYPNGLTKKDIPYVAQIIRVADEYDAIVTKRQYTTHINISETLKELIKDARPIEFMKTVALDSLKQNYNVGKINAKALKALFKVVIDDTLYEISCVMEYIEYLDEQINRLEKIEKYFSKWHICEDEYKNIILTKNLEIYILELPKFEKYTNTNLNLNAWVKFITNPGGITMDDMENNKSLKEAKQVLQQISDDEKEQYLAEQRLMYIMDQKAIEAAGFDKGKEEGKKTKAEEIAKAMLKQNIDLTIIISCTGLTENEIKSLK